MRLSVWHVWRGAEGTAFGALVAAFNAENVYGIEANAVYQGGISEMPRMLTAGLNAGELPHVAVLMPYQYNVWRTTGGRLADLSAFADDMVIGYAGGADFYPVFWERDVMDGVRWGVPAAYAAQVVAANVELIEHLPEDFSAFSATACASGWLFAPDTLSMLAWQMGFGGQVEREPGAYTFNNAETERAFRTLYEWHDEDCLRVPASFGANEAFAAQEGALFATSTSDFALIEETLAETGNEDGWTVLPFIGEAGAAITVYGSSFVALDGSEVESLASWLFLRYVLDHQADFIAAGGFLPVRESQAAALTDYQAEHPQWAAAVELLPLAVAEPAGASWSEVRRALSDAAVELFGAGFEVFELPGLLEQLQATADELAAAQP
jgi:hypothetical protein